MKFNKAHKILVSVAGVGILFYGVLIFGVPALLNSSFMVEKYENILAEKTGFPVKIEGFKFKLNPTLSFDVSVDKVFSKSDKNVEVLDAEDLEYNSKNFSLKPKSVNVKNVYADFSEMQKYLKEGKKKDSKDSLFNPDYLPLLNIRRIFVKLDKSSTVEITNLKSQKTDDGVVCAFLAKILTPYSKYPIFIGREGVIYYSDDLYVDDLSIEFPHSKLSISGEFKNLNMYGESIPVEELEKAFVFFYRLKHLGKKNFIENFQNFTGTMDVDLNFSKDGVRGKCTTHNLGADFSNYMIPVKLPVVVFNFEGRKVWAKTVGTFGTEPVKTDFLLTGLATDSVDVVGNVSSRLTNKFSQKYFKPITIKGGADAKVKYQVQGKNVDIYYSLGLDRGNDLITQFGGLNNIDKKRLITAHTLKQGDKIFLKNYKYRFLGQQPGLLFKGEGLFEKIDGHYKPSFITFKTNGDLPVVIIKSFLKDLLDNGTFNGDLKYDFLKKHLYGGLNVNNAKHSDFLYFENMKIDILEDVIKFGANGTFFDSPINIKFDAVNDFRNGLLVNDINIFLEKFYLKRGNITSVKSDFDNKKSKLSSKTSSSTHKNYNIEIKQGKLVVGNIAHSRFNLHDVEIEGNMKDGVVNFIIPQTSYAKGDLSAKGKYNVINHSSDIHFFASDIDSNEVATNIFKLPNQFEGSGFATLHLMTKNKLNDIHAHATFAINDGFLPKLGSREFIFNRPSKFKKILFFVNKPIKFTLSKISNIDFSKPNVFYSDLRGSFILNNDEVEDVKIFSESDYLSLFIEGNYNIDNENGNLCIWGRHNRIAEKKIRIFKIPLSLLYRIIFRVERTKDMYKCKIDQIPPIKAKPHEESIFRVDVDGNLNSNDLNVKMRDLK